MMLLRFLLSLFEFIGVLTSAAALVLAVIMMLRFPPFMITFILACLLLHEMLKLFPKTQTRQ